MYTWTGKKVEGSFSKTAITDFKQSALPNRNELYVNGHFIGTVNNKYIVDEELFDLMLEKVDYELEAVDSTELSKKEANKENNASEEYTRLNKKKDNEKKK